MSDETNVPVELLRFNFTPEDLTLLAEYKEEWQLANRTERSQIATRAFQDMKKANKNWKDADKKLKKDGVYTWFHMYGRKRESVEKFRSVKKWTARTVFGTEVADELKETIQMKTGGWKGASSGLADNKNAFSLYQKELSKLWNNTSDKEKERLDRLAELWNQMGPPPKQQAKNAEKAFKYIRSFCKQMKKSSGMDCVVMTFHKDEKGTVVTTGYEYMRELGGTSFFQANPEWETKPIMALLSAHGKRMHDSEDAMSIVQNGATSRKPYLQLETDDDGHPLLPDPSEWPKKGMDKKSLVRSYVAIAYRQATGNGNGIPPWTSIIQTPDNHFDADQLPEGFTLLDPSKMKDPQVQELLDFWYKRQVDGDEGIGFQFQSKATDEVRKRKRSTSSTRSDRPSLKRKEKGKGKAKQVLTWKDYIQPDSRRRTRRSGSVSSESSQEEFDFSTIDQESSDSDPAHNVKEKPGQSSSMKQVAGKKSWKERIVGKPKYVDEVSSRSTFKPRSRQSNFPINEVDKPQTSNSDNPAIAVTNVDDVSTSSLRRSTFGPRFMQAREHDVLPENRSDAVVTATLSGKQNKKEEEPPSSGRKSAEKPKRKMIVEVEIKPLTLNQSDRGVVHTNIEAAPAPRRVTRSTTAATTIPKQIPESISAKVGAAKARKPKGKKRR